ncbi:MAG: proton-conducting membrane transporter [Lachnospiraceae bacterium]|nr:proton-conducting membrane transporter [Lachnospiraceae bacterium]
MGIWILIPVFLPVIVGVLYLMPFKKDEFGDGDKESLDRLHRLTAVVMVVSAALALLAAWSGENSYTWFELMEGIPIYFQIDGISRLFVTVFSIAWVLVCFYSFTYMGHEGNERRFFGFYLIVYGVLVALCFAGNLVTLYLFYELMTLTSMPMVLHSGSRESIMAALKYLFYSMCGAYLGLFAIFFLYKYCDSITFTAGGTLNLALAQGHTGILLAAVMAALIGFGAKAGMFPLHAWLPTAHPVAPAPASAVLSGIIAKAGVLSIIRVMFYIVGADFIRGTWVQTAWMTLSLLTVFMGSMLAFREKVFKKRLAYSTVSQVSYILFGLSVLSPTGMEGALLHVVFHAFIKCALFLTAGIFIFQAGYSRVDQLEGIGKKMPKTLWCFTFASLALVGIPPASGFISKWYLAQGALEAEIGVFRWVGPAILLLSALLTAGYLLSIVTNGFFPKVKDAVHGAVVAKASSASDVVQESAAAVAVGAGHGMDMTKAADAVQESASDGADAHHASGGEITEAPLGMLIPLAIFAALSILLGVFPNPLIQFVSGIAATVL